MAIATAHQPINMNESPYFDDGYTSYTSSSLIVQRNNYGDEQEFYGSGFQFSGPSGSPSAGTVQATTYFYYDDPVYSISGVSIPLVTLNQWLVNEDPNIFSYVFSGSDTFNGSSGADLAYSYNGNDNVHGNGGNDILSGGAGNDKLWGDAGDDSLDGVGGNDLLYGGAGRDTMNGGAGADRFVFQGAALAAANSDKIKGFSTVDDLIQLDDAMFANIGGTGNIGSRFYSSASATAGSANDANCRVIYNTETGKLFYDADGFGGDPGVLFATLLGSPDGLTGADIKVF